MRGDRNYGVRYRSPSPPRMKGWNCEHSRRRHGIEEETYSHDYERSRRAEDVYCSVERRYSGEYKRRFYNQNVIHRDGHLREAQQLDKCLLDGCSSEYNRGLDERDKYKHGDTSGRLDRLGHNEDRLHMDSSPYNRPVGVEDMDGHRDRDGHLRRLSRYDEGISHGYSTSMRFQWKSDKPVKSSTDVGYGSKLFTNDYGISATTVSTERGYHDSYITQSRSMLDKPISVETDRRIVYPSHSIDDGISRIFCSGNVSCSSYADGNLPRNLCRDRDIHKDLSQLDKISPDMPLVRKLYEEEENPVLYRKDASDHIFSSSSALKDLSPVPRESLYGSSDASRTGTSPIDHAIYAKRLRKKSPCFFESHLGDTKRYGQTSYSPKGGKCGDCTHPGVRSLEFGVLAITSDDASFYGRTGRFHEEDDNYNLLGSILYPTVKMNSEGSRKELIEKRSPWDHSLSSNRQINFSPGESDIEILGYRNEQQEYKTTEYHDQENPYLGEYHVYGKGSGGYWSDEHLEMPPIRKFSPCIDSTNGVSKKRENARKQSLHEYSSSFIKQEHFPSEKSIKYSYVSKTSPPIEASCERQYKECHEQWISGNIEPVRVSKKSQFGCSMERKRGRKYVKTSHQGISDSISSRLSIHKARNVRKPSKSSSRDIKKRLGPCPHNAHVSYPAPKTHKCLSTKSLGTVCQAAQATLPWFESRRSYKQDQMQDCSEGSFCDEGEDTMGGNMTSSKTEPSEDSEDFKQLLQAAFLKFVKKLNENSALKRRLLKQGKAGDLKCSICGSNSEIFAGAESLAVHAFTSPKNGFRSQHLGFLKALCLLMGWKSFATPDNAWVCQSLLDSEAQFLKEDLIVWPPIVIIQNASLISSHPEERVVVSTEKFEDILKEMGFGDKTQVRWGEPANQSVMLVRFNSTFTGLQEAERLHKSCAEVKHGKVDLQLLNSNNSSSNNDSEDTQKPSLNKMNNVLYGYLATAEDLDKLDFETKKRCFVKSKKELQDIANAPING